MENNTTFKLTITGLGTSITRNITPNELARIMLLITRSSDLSSFHDDPLESTSISQVTIREFLNEKNASTNPQKIATIATYLKERDYKSVTIKVFEQNFESAAEPIPKNITRDIRDAVKFGWIAESHKEQGAYFVTASGETIVRAGFSNVSSIPGKSKKRHIGKALFKPVAIRSEVQNITIDQHAAGLKKYWDLTKGEKILWICVRLQQMGVHQLNFKELSYIASHSLGDNIEPKSITALISSHKKANRVATPIENEARYIRVLQPGIEYVSVSDGASEQPKGLNSKTEETEKK